MLRYKMGIISAKNIHGCGRWYFDMIGRNSSEIALKIWAGDGLHGWVSVSTLFNVELYKEDAGGLPTLPNFGQCWPTSGIQGQWFLICRSCEMHLIHYDVSYPRVIWHILWAATKIGLLENVLGFRSVLNTVLAVIQRNIPGSLYWTGHWNLVIGLQHESSFNY